MVHITKAKGGYMVVNRAKNGRVLSTSEILSTKAKCLQNISSHLKECMISMADHLHPVAIVQDDITEKVFYLDRKGNKISSGFKLEKVYKSNKKARR